MAASNIGFKLSPQPLLAHPGRRRDKPQLSCHFCRRRKKKCDRKHPCSTCVKLEIGHECQYNGNQKTTRSDNTHKDLRHLTAAQSGGSMVRGQDQAHTPRLRKLEPQRRRSVSVSPTPIDLKLNKFGNDYKDASHWTAVLSSATNSKYQDAEANETRLQHAQDESTLPVYQTVLLFDLGKQTTTKELLDGLPCKSTCDKLISSYFRLLENSSLIHGREFLKRYNKFWECPDAAPASWLGLLYSTICIAVQFEFDGSCPEEDDNCAEEICFHLCDQEKLMNYREKTVQCLIHAQYGKGGPFIMETLIHYFTIENYMHRDSNIGLWLLIGNIVQIAMRMGYHRDPRHFKALSPCEGEIRRRVWARLYMFDVGLALQLGLPTVIKASICDTLPPRNISDDDFDSTSRILPPARPDSEVTHTTVIIGKLRMYKALASVSDALSSLTPYSLADAMRIDADLQNALNSLPQALKHRPPSESLLDSPFRVFQRINVKLIYLRGKILLHWKFFAMSKEENGCLPSRNIVVESAIESLKLQHLTTNELRPYRRLCAITLNDSAVINHVHLLATSVMCFYLRHFKDIIDGDKLNEIRTLLETTQDIWHRSSKLSLEARRASDALSIVLKSLGERNGNDPQLTQDTDAVREPFSWPQGPFTYFNSLLDDLPQMPVGGDVGYMCPPFVSPMDDWAPSTLPVEEFAFGLQEVSQTSAQSYAPLEPGYRYP